MTDNNPWTDDRARQSSLIDDDDDDALRTMDRSGEKVTSSSEFADDRDAPGGMDTGEQAGLFSEEEEIEGQQSLGGGTATRREAGIVEELAEPEPEPIGGGSPRLEADLLPEELPGGFEFDDLRTSSGGGMRDAVYARGDEEIRLEELDGSFAVFDEGNPSAGGTFDEFESAVDRVESIAERRADYGDDRDRARLELDPDAAEAGVMTARLAERRVDDLDRDTLKSVREELAGAREEGGVVELREDELGEFSDAIAEFGADASPAQRPEGFGALEDRVFEVEAGETAPDRDLDLDREEPETVEIEFGRRAVANDARDELPEGALTGEYDRRHSTIEVRTDRLEETTLDRVTGMAADSKAYEEEKAGQVELSRRERNQIDFTETSVPHARSVKAIMLEAGVDDWAAMYDPTLTVDEHRNLAARASRDEQGRRMDAGESAVEKAAQARRRTASELEEYAITGAKAGESEAIETLTELGWDPSEARSLAEAAGDDRERAAVLDVAIGRAVANGRFLAAPPERAPEAPVKYRRQGNGRFIGNRIEPDPPIARDPADGRFVLERRS